MVPAVKLLLQAGQPVVKIEGLLLKLGVKRIVYIVVELEKPF